MEEPLIEVKNLSFSYGEKEVLADVNLEIFRGTVLGIVGPNGGGKTTLLKILLGLLKGYRGEVKIRCTFSPHNKDAHHRCMGYVPQKSTINKKFPATVRDTVKMGLYGLLGWRGLKQDEENYINWLMEEVGIINISNRSVNEISGGQLQRTLIARALVSKPALLFLDEPLVGVDQAGVMQFLDLIIKLKERLGLTVLLVTHDFQAVSICADKLACLNHTIHFHDNPNHLSNEGISKIYACGFEAYQQVEKIIHNSQGGPACKD